ncbi:MAG: G5 domain-containing protein [Bacteroidota bacterium]
MKHLRGLAILALVLLSACQPAPPGMITVLDADRAYSVPARSRLPADLFVSAGLVLGPGDAALYNGQPVPLDQPLPASASAVQLRRALTLTLVAQEGERKIHTTAATVGKALHEAGLALYAADRIDPPPDTPLTGLLTVTYTPSRQLTITTQDFSLQARSSAGTVGEALAEAAVPLLGLDYSRPAENAPLPADGQIRVVHVSEALVLAQKPLAFKNEFQASAEVPLDQQQVLNPGQPGLMVSRVRIRYEDGVEVSRKTESESLVRPPQDRIVGYGTKVEIKDAVVDGVHIEYWRAVQMFATAYSPCHSGPGRCYPNTASGKPVKQGVVALRTDLYMAMRGQALYIPGYGRATVEDACGGCVGKPWIDLGYSDSEYRTWGTWVTVYFLTPVPANPIYVLD